MKFTSLTHPEKISIQIFIYFISSFYWLRSSMGARNNNYTRWNHKITRNSLSSILFFSTERSKSFWSFRILRPRAENIPLIN